MATKASLHSKNLEFNEDVVGKDLTRDELREQFPLARTLPVVLVDGLFVGGYNELMNKLLGDAVSGMTL